VQIKLFSCSSKAKNESSRCLITLPLLMFKSLCRMPSAIGQIVEAKSRNGRPLMDILLLCMNKLA
jgi:hypothetical protein